MANLNLLVSRDIKDWIDSRVQKGEFASADDYLSDLVDRDRAERGTDDERIAALRRIVEDAERSGVSERTVDHIFAEAVARTKARGTYLE